MRVLLDEQLPRSLAKSLAGHEVRTVAQEAWAGAKNGELLRRAVASGFEAFVTADQNLSYQQNLRGHAIFVIVLVARSIALEDLQPLVPGVLDALRRARPGELARIEKPG